MTTVFQSRWPKKCSPVQHHEQDQNVHFLDGDKNDRWLFELQAEDLLSLTREQFNDFRQADMIRMIGKSSPAPPGPTAPMTTLPGYTQVAITSESQ